MSASPPRPPKGLLTRGLKLLGHLTSPETRSGRVFSKVERGLTHVSARLNESPTWLRLSGGLLRRRLNLRIRRHTLVEGALHALRLPASTDVEILRDQLRRMGDQAEALNAQLELLVEQAEREERQASPPEDALPEPRPRRPARRRHSA
jgi:hypothetical protein